MRAGGWALREKGGEVQEQQSDGLEGMVGEGTRGKKKPQKVVAAWQTGGWACKKENTTNVWLIT